MATVVLDASEAALPQPRGWVRYVLELMERMPEVVALRGGTPGPELVWEQVGLPHRLRRLGADLVHSPNCFLPLRRPCPGVVTVHDLAFEEFPEGFGRRTAWKYRTFAPRAVRSAERVICVSQWTADDLCRRYGADPERMRVIPNGPCVPRGDLEPPPGPYLLAVGDLRPKKNHAALVRGFLTLRERGLEHRLVLAGMDAGEGARLRELAGDAPVELTGWIDDAHLDALLRGADALVHPSLYEGFGIVLLEAMARGVPVVCANATALPETAGEAAELFDPLDVEDMAGAIERVVADRRRHALLAEAGRARAAWFSWERTAAATRAVYEELL